MRPFHALPGRWTRWGQYMMLAGIFVALLVAGQFAATAVAHAGYASAHTAASTTWVHPPRSPCSGVSLPC